MVRHHAAKGRRNIYRSPMFVHLPAPSSPRASLLPSIDKDLALGVVRRADM
jgi:hypothetical protein